MHVELSVEDQSEENSQSNEHNTETISGSQVACAFVQTNKIQRDNTDDSMRTVSITMGAVGVIVALYISLVLLL